MRDYADRFIAWNVGKPSNGLLSAKKDSDIIQRHIYVTVANSGGFAHHPKLGEQEHIPVHADNDASNVLFHNLSLHFLPFSINKLLRNLLEPCKIRGDRFRIVRFIPTRRLNANL
jgi:hypothetical protein